MNDQATQYDYGLPIGGKAWKKGNLHPSSTICCLCQHKRSCLGSTWPGSPGTLPFSQQMCPLQLAPVAGMLPLLESWALDLRHHCILGCLEDFDQADVGLFRLGLFLKQVQGMQYCSRFFLEPGETGKGSANFPFQIIIGKQSKSRGIIQKSPLRTVPTPQSRLLRAFWKQWELTWSWEVCCPKVTAFSK